MPTIKIDDVEVELEKCGHCKTLPSELEAQKALQKALLACKDHPCPVCGLEIKIKGISIAHRDREWKNEEAFWKLMSVGYVFKRSDDTVPFNQQPNQVLGQEVMDVEVRRLAINPPGTRTDRMTTLLRSQAEQGISGREGSRYAAAYRRSLASLKLAEPLMGAPESDTGVSAREKPQHTVEIFWSIPDQYSQRIAPVFASVCVSDQLLSVRTLSRPPADEELRVALAAFSVTGATRQSATEDVFWALLNSAEFVLNH
jgi:hypothetical protein